ncbi:MAG: elongation factor Ts [Streptosporangiales bacterium]|nr:elongation factor Ts [Streptosporangiales bacterium]
MANFTAADIRRLRELTAVGMLDTKNALVEADGDFDKAVEILRLRTAKEVNKRQSRTATNGLVAARLDGPASGVLVEVNCETDFVAKNERFQDLGTALARQVAESDPADVDALLASTLDGRTVQEQVDEVSAAIGEKLQVRRIAALGGNGRHVFLYLHRTDPDLPPQIGVLVELDADEAELGKEIAQNVAAMSPRFLSRDDVPAESVETTRREAEQMARDEGKPEQVVPKIVEGRINSFFKDVVLVEQIFAKDGKKTVKALLGEKGVNVTGFARFRVGESQEAADSAS